MGLEKDALDLSGRVRNYSFGLINLLVATNFGYTRNLTKSVVDATLSDLGSQDHAVSFAAGYLTGLAVEVTAATVSLVELSTLTFKVAPWYLGTKAVLYTISRIHHTLTS